MNTTIPPNIPTIRPVEIMIPGIKDESEIPGKSVIDQKMIKTIFAETIEIIKDTAILNTIFKFTPFLVSVSTNI